MRYKVLAFCVALAAVTYLDRVCISILAPSIMNDLGLTKVQMSFVFSAFTLAYGLFEIPTGAWGDKIGTRRVLTRIVLWWSSFTILTATAFNYVYLLTVRFLFGAGEAGAWPNSARTLSRWFPSKERGTAQGIFFMGAHLAGGLTPLAVTAMMHVMPWRLVLVIFGAVGFVWAFSWFRWFRDEPSQHPSVSPEERQYIESGRATESSHRLSGVPWGKIFRNRSVVALCVMYFTQTYGFYFYITWLPTYLKEARGFSDSMLGLVSGMPLLFSVVADLLGGITTDRLTSRFGSKIGRAIVGVSSFVLASGFMLVGASIDNAALAIVLISIAAAWSNFVLGAAWGSAVDVGGHHAGVVSAFMNTAGQVGGFLSPVILAFAVRQFQNWAAPLLVTGALYMLGAACWFFIDSAETVHE